MSAARLLHAVNVLVVVLLLGFSIAVYAQLPERIPTHYDVDGRPDGWSPRTWLNWLTLPAIGVAVAAVLYAVGAFAPRRPDLINLPDKKKLLELPLSVQRWVLHGLSLSMYASATTLLLMFFMLQYGAYRAAAHGDARDAILGGVLFGLVALPLVSLSSLVIVQSRLKRAHHERLNVSQLSGLPDS